MSEKLETGITPEDMAIYRAKWRNDVMTGMVMASAHEALSIGGTLPEIAGISGMRIVDLVTNRINARGH